MFGARCRGATGGPKDPSVLKIVRRANSLRREKNATARAKRYGECSEVLVFSRKKTWWTFSDIFYFFSARGGGRGSPRRGGGRVFDFN